MDDFFEAVQAASLEYKEFYLPDLQAKQKARARALCVNAWGSFSPWFGGSSGHSGGSLNAGDSIENFTG
jgi:hypothetical protein